MSFSPFQLLKPRRLSDRVYVELVDDLFSIVPSLIIFALCQILVGAAIVAETSDRFIAVMAVMSVLISIERIMMIRSYQRDTEGRQITRAEAQHWERQFTIRSIATSVIVSAMGAYAFAVLPETSIHMLMTGVLFAYAAGTVTRVSNRPRLALLNLLVVALPSVLACLFHGGAVYAVLSVSMIVFMLGACEVVQHLFDTLVSQLTLKQRFAGLAHQDALTGLSNRLGLAENLEMALADAQRRGDGLAVHSLDLDRFKAANDLYGHPVGDAVLKEVARRLTSLTRTTDLLVRLGGDEFMMVQTGVATRDQAVALASRIVDEIGKIYTINGYTIEIGTSVGIALSHGFDELGPDELLARADQALYQAKRMRSGYMVYTIAPQLVPDLSDSNGLESYTAGKRNVMRMR